VSQKDLAGNVFASMDKDLSADSDDEEGNTENCEDEQQPPEPENISLVGIHKLLNFLFI